MKIRTYLALMVAAVLIPVILFSALSLDMLLKSEREAAVRGVRETARTALVSIDRELTNAQSAVRMLSMSRYLAHEELAGFYEQARFADQPGVTWTALLDEHGRQLVNTSLPFGAPLPPPMPAESVVQALESSKPQVSNLIRADDSNALRILVEVPVSTPDGQRFVIAQGFRTEHFAQVLQQLKTPPRWIAGVFDRNGLVIAQTSGGQPDQEVQPDLRDAIRRAQVGVVRITGGGSSPRLLTVLERSSFSGWTVAIGVPEAEIEAVARKALLYSAFGLLFAIACAAGAALFFTRRLSLSIRQAAQSAHALERAEGVGPAEHSGVREVDEVQAAIAAAAKVIADEKRSRQAAEAERERLFASEHAARTMAEQQNRAKDEFLAMLGHELRNPLSAIMNATSVIGFKHIGPEQAERARDIVARQSKHLVRIVDDLLDVGRVHSGKILLERQPLRLDLVVSNYVATLKETGRAKGHALTCHTEPAWINADPTRLEQVTANLLDNALKYTPAGGSIHAEVRVDGDDVVLSVRDTGIGISAELMPYVFDLFVQGARALDRAQGGLGVGLALVRRLVTMHGGRISASSAGAGQGSTFELRLPRVAAPAVAPALAVAPARAGGIVLLIEDNQDGRDMLAAMLRSEGYEVMAAEDGLVGLAMAARRAPDVALIDIGLPGIDGYEVARRMRADASLRHVRLIALTGYGLAHDQQRSLAAGFDAHLVKPVDLRRLVEVMHESSSVGDP